MAGGDLHGSQGNRLVESRRYIAATDETLESRIYLYDKAGRVTQLVRTIAGDVDPEHDDAQWHRGTEFWYNTRGQLWMARSARWQLEGEEQPGGGVATRVVNAEYLSAMEYRYDSGRRRYMTRRCDPGSMAPLTAEASWHDYLGDSIHADHAVDYEPGQSLVVEEKAAHVPGVARYDHSSPTGDRVRQLFGNLIGTTEAECDDEGTVTGRTVYTAFGEVVPPPGSGGGLGEVASRYGYAGAWGYQSPGNSLCGPPGEEVPCDPLAELGWLHVGERYYDPHSGRFVQRDPIGIAGGFNVYVYVGNAPTNAVDPQGLRLESNLPVHSQPDIQPFLPKPFPGSPQSYVGGLFGLRSNVSWGDFASYLRRHRWDWDFGSSNTGELFGTGSNVMNVTLSTCVGGVRGGVGTPPHHTSWIHKMFPKSAAARAAGRVSLIPLVWEGFWDLGVILRYPFDLN